MPRNDLCWQKLSMLLELFQGIQVRKTLVGHMHGLGASCLTPVGVRVDRSAVLN